MTSRLLSTGALLLALIWTAQASAYTIMKAQSSGKELRWTSLPMKFNIESNSPAGVSTTQCRQAIQAAYKAWADVSCSYFTTSYLGVVSVNSNSNQDHKNTNIFPSSWSPSFPGNALGFTRTLYDPSSGKILDADILYNPNHPWSTTGASNAVDLQAVATHEIGHEMGFNHSAHGTATMYYAVGKGNTGPRSLHSDDISAVCYSYGNGKPKPPECTTNGHCAQGESCISQKCMPYIAPKASYGGSCKYSSDCTSKLCVGFTGGGKCTQSCTSSACPGGDVCVPLSGSGKACKPGSAGSLKALGETCKSSNDCKSSYCVGFSGKVFCTQKCTPAKKDCPTGFACTATTTGGICTVDTSKPPPPPPPPPAEKKKKMGETCDKSKDCESGFCANTGKALICSAKCDSTVSGTCPSGFKCATAASTTKGICLKGSGSQPPPPPPKTTPPAKGTLGATCTDSSGCNSGLCVLNNTTNTRFCSQLCDPNAGCGQGFDCVDAGGGKHACKPAANSTNPAAPGYQPWEESSGCNVAPSDEGPSSGLMLLFLISAFLLLRGLKPQTRP